MGEEIEDKCFRIRGVLLDCGKEVFEMMKDPVFQGEQQFPNEHGEMKANIMLTYRHLEDARMRLGKVVQAHDGGKSAYPK